MRNIELQNISEGANVNSITHEVLASHKRASRAAYVIAASFAHKCRSHRYD